MCTVMVALVELIRGRKKMVDSCQFFSVNNSSGYRVFGNFFFFQKNPLDSIYVYFWMSLTITKKFDWKLTEAMNGIFGQIKDLIVCLTTKLIKYELYVTKSITDAYS